jgi:hypothetical protein
MTLGSFMARYAVPAILSVWALSTLAKAAPPPATEEASPPDWTGFYTLVRRGPDLQGFKPVGGDLDKVIIPHLQPWARMKMEATDGTADDTGAVCKADGIFRNPPFAGRFLWLPANGKIIQVFHEINTAGVRRIYLNRQHPKNLLPTWNGDSVGHWEGDTLVVDTIGFNDKSWLMSAMEPHTEETHMIERIRRVANGSLIEIVTVIEDRHSLTSAYTYTRYYKKQDEEITENICNDALDLWKQWRNEHLKVQYDRARKVK